MTNDSFDWDSWVPGDERSADVMRTLGAPMIAEILLRLNIDITDLSADSRIRIVQEVTLGLSEGQAPDTVTRRLRDIGLERGRLFTIVNTLTAWAQTRESLVTFGTNGIDRVAWCADENSCETCIDNAAAGSVELGLHFPSGHDGPPAHPDCRCTIVASIVN